MYGVDAVQMGATSFPRCSSALSTSIVGGGLEPYEAPNDDDDEDDEDDDDDDAAVVDVIRGDLGSAGTEIGMGALMLPSSRCCS